MTSIYTVVVVVVMCMYLRSPFFLTYLVHIYIFSMSLRDLRLYIIYKIYIVVVGFSVCTILYRVYRGAVHRNLLLAKFMKAF